jgi:prolyl-tRNA synthetase
MDEKGLVWPASIAPATHYLIVMGDNLASALRLAAEIEKSGGKVIIDDREKA